MGGEGEAPHAFRPGLGKRRTAPCMICGKLREDHENLKHCPRCEKDKPADQEHWHAAKKTVDGLQPWCRDCKKRLYEEKYSGPRERKKSWARRISRKYGLSERDYLQILKDQGGRCAICQSDNPRSASGKNFHVDHCHSTQAVRGLLCGPCNRALGLCMDSPEILEAAADYLRKAA